MKESQLGKVKTEQIKKLAKELIKRYPSKFSTIFDDNKHIVDELTEGTTTRVRNQVAGYITRTVALSQNGDVVEEEILEDSEE
jgi:small subunit ribosomal protein S17e